MMDCGVGLEKMRTGWVVIFPYLVSVGGAFGLGGGGFE